MKENKLLSNDCNAYEQEIATLREIVQHKTEELEECHAK